MDGSTYATGKLIPDAFSILSIPDMIIGNLSRINENILSESMPFLCASLTRINGFNESIRLPVM